ncbi:MAG: ABC transporter ATP-binding protein [Nanobdellota archaeon]
MIFLRLLSGSLAFVVVFFTGKIVDFFTTYQVGESLLLFYLYVGGILVLGIARTIIRIFAKFFIQKSGVLTQKNLRLKGFKKLLELELGWHEKENTGNKIQRVQSGSKSAYDFARLLSNELASFLIDFIGAIIIFIFIGWKYALFMIVFSVVYLFVLRYYEDKLYYSSRNLHRKQEVLSGKAHEAISNIVTVKTLGLHKRLKHSMHSHEKHYMDLWKVQKIIGQNKMRAINILLTIGQASFFLIVGFDVVQQAITVGQIVIFTGYYARFSNGISKYSTIGMNLIQFKVKMQRLQEILRQKEQTFDKKGTKDISSDWKSISFENVSFKYDEKHTIENLNLKIKRNEKIGVVGSSGAGKSTLIKLLLRLYEPTSGTIRIGKHSVLDLKRFSLRKEITVISQDHEVFNLSLQENITLSQNNIDKKQLSYAIKASGLTSVIKKLPFGLQTIIGEKGYRLSGGERQRVGIARALYRKASVIIMDEATSHLDTKTEREIQEAINNIKDTTMIIIAHRLSTLENVDRIVYLDTGRVVEDGDFKELVRKRGNFFKLLQKQKMELPV